ncbi:Uncharacterised protein [Bacillus freudenreichii]|nr:Uncharacterised protein [Bacillus freudenreichii]
MAKIIIDTNVFLDFYRSNKESLKKLEELKEYASYLLFPEQVFNEFNRNRSSEFEKTKNEFEKFKSTLKPFNSNFISSFSEYRELLELNKKVKDQIDALVKKIDLVKMETDNDEIYKVVTELYFSEHVQKLNINEEIIRRARNRQLLGNPPGTNSVTIGDEVIWESILECVNEPFILVTNDKTFIRNEAFLSEEFKAKKGYNLIGIVEKISEAIKVIVKKRAMQLEELEEETEKIKANLRAKGELTASGIVIKKGNYGVGFTPSSETPDMTFYCGVCGNPGPWNGARCMTCGNMDDSY